MIRLGLVWIACIVGLWGSSFGREIALPLLEVQHDRAYVSNRGLQKGQTGIILRWLDAQHATIIAKTVVGEIKGKQAELIFLTYDALAQASMPVPKLMPRQNDVAILKKFYDRGVVVAPTQELYQKVTQSYPKTHWIHPDLFASELAIEGIAAPVKKDFRRFCDHHNIGIVYLVNGNSGEVRDCQSFALIKKDYLTGRAKKENITTPFYSRLGNLESSWMDFTTGEIGDYYLYYNQLTEGNLPETEDSSIFGRIMKIFDDG